MAALAAALLAWGLAGCASAAGAAPATANPAAAAAGMPSKAHHVAGGFRNNYAPAVSNSFGALLRWRWNAFRYDLPPSPATPTPTALPQLARLAANTAAGRMAPGAPATPALPSATWIGHATVLVQSGGLNVLTDPIFSQRASPVQFLGPQRAQPPGIALADLPPVDVVLISHNHYDHLDRLSALQLNERSQGKTLFLVPLGNKAWLADLGIANVVELDWWQSHTVRGVAFHLTPVQHWSARSLGDRSKTLWGGWAVLAPDLHWYFAGDSGYSKDFSDTRDHFAAQQAGRGFDLSLLPVGAYEPRWFMQSQHMNPAESVQAHKDLATRQSLGIHWGTFELTDEPLDQPPKDLAQARRAQGVADDDFFLLSIGETRWLQPRPAAARTP